MEATTLAVGVLYFAASSMMLLVNKLVVTFIPAAVTLTTVQYLVSALFVLYGAACSIPFLFSLAIFSNMKLLESANVETFMVFRFSTPISVAMVDFALMGKSLPTLRTWLSFTLIVSGAVWYTLTDKGFSVETYFWVIIYLVTITAEMIVVKHIFSIMKMSNWTRVYLNNVLSLLFQPFFFVFTKEHEKFPFTEPIPMYGWAFLALSSVFGIILAWSGTTLRARISATTFTVVGVACKVVTELINLIMWDRHAHIVGLLALLTSFIGSIIFVPSKARTADSTVSNMVWSGLNRMFCGALRAMELESPEFILAESKGKYEQVKTEDLEMEAIDHGDDAKVKGKS